MSNAYQENMGQMSAWRNHDCTGRDMPATCVSEMDDKDLRRALRKLELSDMSPLDAYNLWLATISCREAHQPTTMTSHLRSAIAGSIMMSKV